MWLNIILNFNNTKWLRKWEMIMENKKSKLCFDMKIARKLLKMNGEIKFCPYCGKGIEENCECHKNFVVDIKPYRNDEGVVDKDRSVMVFNNNNSFKADYNQLMEELIAKKVEREFEPVEVDVD